MLTIPGFTALRSLYTSGIRPGTFFARSCRDIHWLRNTFTAQDARVWQTRVWVYDQTAAGPLVAARRAGRIRQR